VHRLKQMLPDISSVKQRITIWTRNHIKKKQELGKHAIKIAFLSEKYAQHIKKFHFRYLFTFIKI